MIGPGLVTFFLPTSKSIFPKECFACIAHKFVSMTSGGYFKSSTATLTFNLPPVKL